MSGGEGSKNSEVEWDNLTPDLLLNVFARLTLDEMMEGPLQVCKPWIEAGKTTNVFDFGGCTVQIPAGGGEFDWDAMEDKMDKLLKAYVDRSHGGLKIIKTKLCTDASISYVAQKCPDLEVLWLTSCPCVTDASMTKIATGCTKLKELRILSSFQITESALKMVKDNCPNVEVTKK
ncbi:unnamed protein product [Microthlaspi erraticum]|uniref:F-box domain-containing protein n=1 Tax=Microthlaspi erraticum TaxID=1685480 RepID=A0A6D2K9B5_9BRAS|nr:unnamed protein product [Microthlaspi erraticum]